MHFVYPFIHSKANDRELQLSIASIRKNYQGESKVIVIGDRPAFEVDVVIEQPRSSGAFRDVIKKLWFAVKSKEVADQFVFMMDDIWFVKPITEAGLRTPRHSGCRENLDSWKPSNNWLKSKKRTMIELRSRGFDQYDYSNHCPQFLDKTNVREMFVEWDLMNSVWEWKTIYQNVYGKDAAPCRPYRWRWNGPKSEEKLRKGFSSCSIANCNSSGFDDTANEFISQFLGVPSVTETVPTRSRRLLRIQKSKKTEVKPVSRNPNRYYLKRKPHTASVDLDEIGKRKNSEKPCPGQHRGSCVDVKNNKLCSRRSKRSVPVYECSYLNQLVTIEPYKVGQSEACCKRCDVFWDEEGLSGLIRFLKNKTIAVVGNAIINKNYGKEIDSNDVVVRFNNFEIEGYEEKVGTKTTVWAHCQRDDVKRRLASDTGMLFEFCPNPKGGKHLSDLPLLMGDEETHSKIQIKRPSTGISLLNFLYENNITFSTFGFDGTNANHYFEEVPEKVNSWHDTKSERTEFARLTKPKLVEAVIPWRYTESRQRIFNYVRTWASEKFDRVHVMESGEHEVFNKSRLLNRGVAQCEDTSVVCLLDADMFLEDGSIKKAVQAARHHSKLVKPFSLYKPISRKSTNVIVENRTQVSVIAQWNIKGKSRPSPGGITFCTKKVYNQIGGHDEKFTEWGREDTDFLMQARRVVGEEIIIQGKGFHLWHKKNLNRPDVNRQHYRNNKKKKKTQSNLSVSGDYLISQYKILHRLKKSYGSGNAKGNQAVISQFLPDFNGSTLDFGCGKGELVDSIKCSGYDPAIPRFRDMPSETFDLVVCFDVMEHLAVSDVESTLKLIASKSSKNIILGISCRPADTKLPDGRNAHTVVNPSSWWVEKLRATLPEFRIVDQVDGLRYKFFACHLSRNKAR